MGEYSGACLSSQLCGEAKIGGSWYRSISDRYQILSDTIAEVKEEVLAVWLK
jgi:hypothetical protein